MPVEIKEITIRTEVRTTALEGQVAVTEKELSRMKNQVMKECRKIITQNMDRRNYKR